MMSDSTNNNKVNGHIMSLQQLISAPLVATIDADAMSTERYMKHFMSLAFESYNPVDGSTGALRLISFNFTDSDASGGAEKKVSVPLVSLVTLPLLQIKQADFDFDINIIDAVAAAPKIAIATALCIISPVTLIVLAGKPFWDKLSDSERQILQAAFKEAQAYQRALSRQATTSAMAEVKAKGMKINDVSPAELQRMEAVVRPVTDKFAATYDPL